MLPAVGHSEAHSRRMVYNCPFSVFLLMYKNLISWLSLKSVAVFNVLVFCRLLPLILMEI
jgi:hypothetical protein